MEDLYSMKLHEIKEVNRDLTIIRVPSGWMYIYHSKGGVTSCFVSSRKEKS